MVNNSFLENVISGLNKTPKQLDSKYFYNAEGCLLFQRIMTLPEYYLTNCELEIINEQKEAIIDKSLKNKKQLEVIELGPGDGSKSIPILKCLASKQKQLSYYPIDISTEIIRLLQDSLARKLPSVQVKGRAGEYFEIMNLLETNTDKNKLVIFLGSSIGNMHKKQSVIFLKKLKTYLSPGDMLLIGFDLIKDPAIILKAYNDSSGITAAFNLNLLHRINHDLGGNFITTNFKHYPVYQTRTGACESYLISLETQELDIQGHTVRFKKGEPVFMEISQKFKPEEINEIARTCGFKPIQNFFDDKQWFSNALWEID